MQLEPGGRAKFFKDIAELLIQGKKNEAEELVLKVSDMDVDEVDGFLGQFENEAEDILNTVNGMCDFPDHHPSSIDDALEGINSLREKMDNFTDLMVNKFDIDFKLEGEVYGNPNLPLREQAMDELLPVSTADIYKIGEPEVISDANGDQRISIEIVHFKLDEKKVFSCPLSEDTQELSEKVKTQISKWTRKYFADRGNDIARKATAKLHKSIIDFETILHCATLREYKPIWDYLKNIPDQNGEKESLISSPAKPETLPVPTEPSISDKKYQVESGMMKKLFGGGARKKQELKNKEIFLTDHKVWQAEKEKIEQQNLKLEEKYIASVNAFEEKKRQLQKTPDKQLKIIEKIKKRYFEQDPETVIDYCQMVVSLSSFPGELPFQFELEYLAEEKVLVVDYVMPEYSHLPTDKSLEFYYIRDEDDFEEDDFDFEDKSMTKDEVTRLNKSVLIQIVLSNVYELFRRDEAQAIDTIIFNGFVNINYIDEQLPERYDIISLKTDKKTFTELDLKAINPQACFDHLKGRFKHGIEEVQEIEPFVTIAKKSNGHNFAEKESWLAGLRSIAQVEMQQIRKTIEKKSEILTEPPARISKMPENFQWVNRIWDWADQNGISEDDLPRDRESLLAHTSLNLEDYSELTEIPKEVGNLTKLTRIEITGSKISALPKEICNLSNLTSIFVYCNELRKLPDEIGNLESLEILYCSSNKLQSIPKSIEKLHSLQDLDLSNNDFLEIPRGLFSLSNLRELNFRDNKIQTLSSQIGNLTKLRELDLGYNTITELPPEIGGLTNLKFLYLLNNKLRGLPNELGNLTALTCLNLGKNSLEKLTPEIGKLINLTSLSIDDNQLTELPAEIANLKGLETLSIYGNKLTDIPEEILELNILDPDWNLNDDEYDEYDEYDEDDDY